MHTAAKRRLRIEAAFRPSLHTIARPSLDTIVANENLQEVLEKIELSRQYDLLPSEKIRKNAESEFNCCHVEHKVRGYGSRRREIELRCNKKAAAGNMRCPMHMGMPVADSK